MSGNAVFVGGNSYYINVSNNTVQITAAEILNNSVAGTGTIRLELWLTVLPWNTSGTNSGYEIATDQLGGVSNGMLGANQYFSNISDTVTYAIHPPSGTYFITLVAAEYTGATPSVDGGFVVDSAQTFPNFLVVDGNGGLSQGGSILPPVIVVHNQSVNANASIPAANLIVSVTDPGNRVITAYDFRDDGSGGGYFSLSGVKQVANTWITVNATDLSKLVYVGGAGAGSETVDVAAWDGQWSQAASATVTTAAVVTLPPVIVVHNQSVNANASIPAANLIVSVTDPAGLPVSFYGFRDNGTGGGYFSLSGVKQAENTWITVSATELAKLIYVGGAGSGSETVDVAAWDGQWSLYHSATATTVGASPPVVVVRNQSVNANESLLASNLIVSVTDPGNLAITAYAFRDDGTGGGYFSLNGIKQAENVWITVNATDLSKFVYVGGTTAGSESVDFAAWDGQWSLYDTATVTTIAVQSTAPKIVVTNQTLLQNSSIQASKLIFSVTDPGNLPITWYEFRDKGTGGGYFSLNGVKQAENTWINVSATDLSKLVYVGGSAAGSETVDVAAWDGQWSFYRTATVTTIAVSPPLIAVNNQTVKSNASFQASALVASVYDPNNFAITTYDFRDDGVDGGYFSLSGVKQVANTWITVGSADLSKLVYVGGNSSGSETVDVAAWDGYAWSVAGRATVITQSIVQGAPAVIQVLDQHVNANMSILAQSLIASVTDPNNYAITYYCFRDDGTGGGYLSLNNVKQIANTWITVGAPDLSKLLYVGGTTTGSEAVDVAAWDGFSWSLYKSATVTTDLPQSLRPVVSAMNQSVNANAFIQATSLIASVIDPGNLAITAYDFRDNGTGGGYFTFNGIKQAENTWINVGAADLSKLVYVGGTLAGSETVDVAAWDGQWSTYRTATVTTVAAILPVVLVSDQIVSANSSIQASTLIASVTDSNNYAISSYQFRDTGGGGYLALGGVKQAENTWITVAAADLSKLVYVGASAAGIESVDVAAFDGHVWSAYTSARVTTAGAAGTNSVLALLLDPSIKADVAANLAGNSLNYAGMLKILNDAATGGVTAAEFADLRTLQAHFNVAGGISVSPYVSYISDKLINGDASNAVWTGGALTTTALGNLAAGSSQIQTGELIQKWFLGGDLPAPVFDSPGTVVYVTNTSPLYNLSGTPSANDINQGLLGDCYLLASLAEVAQNEPGAIKSMITDNGNGTYGVRFFMNNDPVYVTVNSQLPVLASSGVAAGNRSSALWSSLIEKAYVQLNAEPSFLEHVTGNVYNLIDSGNADPITQVTGRTVTTYNALQYTQSSWANVKSIIVTAIQNGMEVDLASFGASSIEGKSAFISHHMFSGIGYDSITGDFILRNPWGVAALQDYWTQFEASMSDTFSENSVFFIANGGVGSGAPIAVSTTYSVSTAVANFQAGQLGFLSTLSDSAARVQSSLDVLQTMSSTGLVSSITLTDSGTPVLSLTSPQFASDGAALGCIVGNHAFSIMGLAGNDLINLSICTGGDIVDGGAGTDSVVFGSNRATYMVTKVGAGFTATDTVGTHGTDTLTNIERIKFADVSLALDVGVTQPAGEAQVLLGAVLGRNLLSTKEPLIGSVIGLFDQGYTGQQLSGALMRLPIWGLLANGGNASASNTQIATWLLTTANQMAPDSVTLTAAVASLDTETGGAQGNFLWYLATSAANQTQAGLVGLITTGLEYVG